MSSIFFFFFLLFRLYLPFSRRHHNESSCSIFHRSLHLLLSHYLHILPHHIHKSPLCLLPGSSILIIILPKYSLSLVCKCPNHLSLVSLTWAPNHPTCCVPLMCLFLIFSILFTPKENLNIINSNSSCSVSCLLIRSTVFEANNTAGFITLLHTSTSLASVPPAPCCQYRSQSHLQTSYSMEIKAL